MTRRNIPGKDRDASLAAWLVDDLAMVGPLSTQQVTGGLSNITTVVTGADGRRVVLRRPPEGVLRGGAHDVLREARILQALAESSVPVPTVIALSSGDQVGVPFYVMEHIDGFVPASTAEAEAVAPEHRRRLGLELIEVLVAVQAVDVGAVGLGDMNRATPYLQRQLKRWSAQWEATTRRAVPAVEHVRDRLRTILPQLDKEPDCLVHGDFRLGNVMVPHPPAEPHVAALLDWELATTGHPLADLGFLGARMTAPEEVLAGGADPSSAEGYPTFDELTQHFAQLRGVDVADLPVFVALSAWRWAIIVEGIQQRLSAGHMHAGRDVATDVSAEAAWHRRRVELLADFAADLLD